MKICAIIPSYNHTSAIASIIAEMRVNRLPVFVIDDGSIAPFSETLAALNDPAAGIVVKRLTANQGKGAAVMAGFEMAYAAGFTHAVQVDADGQHDLSILPHLIELATKQPLALISGQPVYDASAPLGRRIGRWITHVWVWIETLSFRIKDSMCGFRVYPLASTMELIKEERVGQRMDFDTEIMVRLFRRGVDVVQVPVHVIYPPGNTSNFDIVRDNWRISLMHTRLVLSLFDQGKHKRSTHWGAMNERGAYAGLIACATVYRLFGRTGCRALLGPIVLYFYLAGSVRRQASKDFLTRILGRAPTFGEGYRHFMNFAMRAVDSFAAWTGSFPAGSIIAGERLNMIALERDPRGALIVVSHLGNADLSRALLAPAMQKRLVVLVHTRHAVNYHRMLEKYCPSASANLIQVTEFGPETILLLKEKVEQGAWIVIAGDRTPVASHGRSVMAPFLGQNAPFAQGPWLLGALLECPVYLLFCLPQDNKYMLNIESFAERIDLPRGQREEALAKHTAAYAARLEYYARMAPLQWFNFFDFWAGTNDYG